MVSMDLASNVLSQINVALSYADKILSLGFSMCSFDFAGTGNSEGNYVSLGHHEQFDIWTVIKYLFQKYNVKQFGLWGRSMGSAAAIKFYAYYEKRKWEKCEESEIMHKIQITSLVLDSCFFSL